ncbi:CPBP family intramembrane metalloprotease [Oscillatoria sp. FACHB-1407]|uniref:CPBP family glutamic-type intramembrane protease n=1 Tax=Oscillatoria sp. FACHB-1407 TaxID=2692847 RepID=UPI0016871712|nr:CPBP family glutamic-type intramembrane protease [Oscillatoria sp. FACHB-1407]MBD2462872.1 CPBP family intramembrane metalloprotease [Oscillatoria sp. FACHB-1407]
MLIRVVCDRIWLAITTFPTWQEWLTAGGLGLLLAVLLIPLGLAIGFLQVEVIRSPKVILTVGAIALFSPGITEELLFRALLLPHPSESVSFTNLSIWFSFSLILFILYHPLNALSLYPAGRPTFMTPGFLVLAALLGVICAIAYLQTGSLWLPVLLHWLAVMVWLLCLGGYRRLQKNEE